MGITNKELFGKVSDLTGEIIIKNSYLKANLKLVKDSVDNLTRYIDRPQSLAYELNRQAETYDAVFSQCLEIIKELEELTSSVESETMLSNKSISVNQGGTV